MAAIGAVATEGGLMEPMTKITTENRAWLGRLSEACTVAAEMLALAEQACGKASSFAEREHRRRTAKARAARAH